MAFKFEKLNVWKKALELSIEIKRICKSFPSEEKYELGSQMRRSADSVCLNISEGSMDQTNSEQKRFLRYSLRSALETVAGLIISQRMKFIDDKRFVVLYGEYEVLVKMIKAFINSL